MYYILYIYILLFTYVFSFFAPSLLSANAGIIISTRCWTAKLTGNSLDAQLAARVGFREFFPQTGLPVGVLAVLLEGRRWSTSDAEGGPAKLL